MALIQLRPELIFKIPVWLLKGRSRFKEKVAQHCQFDASNLPYNSDFLQYLKTELAAGREIVLLTGSDKVLAKLVAKHLGIFAQVLSSENGVNLIGRAKADLAEARFGIGGFDYAGNSKQDFEVWSRCAQAVIVDPQMGVLKGLPTSVSVLHHFQSPKHQLKSIIRALRVHHWAKNILVFVPALAAHQITDAHVFSLALGTSLAFSLLASAVYIFNDLLDLTSDRSHPDKRNRPLAAGEFSIPLAISLSVLLTIISLSMAYWIGTDVGLALSGYFLLNLAYTLKLKKEIILDIILLTFFYSIRLLAGSLATGIVLSSWIICFSQFFFLSLSLLKRSIELKKRLDQRIS